MVCGGRLASQSSSWVIISTSITVLKTFLRIQLCTLPVYVSDVSHEIDVAFMFHHRLGFLLFDTFLIRFA